MSRFDLNREIAQWKKSLFKHRGFEPEDIEELEDHFRNSVNDLIKQGYDPKKAFESVYSTTFKNPVELSRAFLGNGRNSHSFPGLLRSFVKVALRNVRRQSMQSSISFVGLSIAFASVFVISAYILHEFSFDTFHKKANSLYRVVNEYDRASGKLSYPLAPPALGPSIKHNLTAVPRVTRLRKTDDIIFTIQSNQFLESSGFYADSSFLEMFSFPLVSGPKQTVLSAPNTIVLSEQMAAKFFKGGKAIGQTIETNLNKRLTVTGIFADLPDNSHIRFDYLISFQTYEVPDGYLADLNSWGWMGFLTYVELTNPANHEPVTQDILELYKQNNTSKANRDIHIRLQPLKDIYLGSNEISNPHGGVFAQNDKRILMSLVGVAGLIILIASFNYVNLTIAGFHTRMKEIGIRNILGSNKRKLAFQVTIESMLLVFLSGIAGMSLAVLMINLGFAQLQATSLFDSLNLLIMAGSPTLLGIILGLLLTVSFASRLYGLNPLDLLRKQVLVGSAGHFKNGILFIQYMIASCLIILSLIVTKQLDFMNDKDLGYSSESIISISGIAESTQGSYEQMREQIAQSPTLEALTMVSHVFEGNASSGPMRRKEWPEDQSIQTAYFQVDPNFLKVTGIDLIAGRFFSNEFASDSNKAVVLNESAAKAMNIDQLEGQKVLFTGERELQVIGVVKDFHYQSLHHRIRPMGLIMPFTALDHLLVSYHSANLPAVFRDVEDIWDEANASGSPVEIRFLSSSLQRLYQNEHKLGTLIGFFSVLAIFLSCIGLLGLTSITISQRIKQICIRKVLGGSSVHILMNLCRSSFVSAGLAAGIGWPISLWLGSEWLANYAYHYSPGIVLWLISVLIIFGATLITASLQYAKITYTNPAKTLRNE